MNIVFWGNHIYGYYSLFEMIKSGIIPSLIIANLPKEDEKEWYPSVNELAVRYNIRVIRTNKPSENIELKNAIKNIEPDLFVVSSYRNIIDKSILKIPKLGAINLHMAPLPKYRGAHPENWAIINGEEYMGYTVHFLDEGIDTGDLISQKELRILPEDDILSLTFKLADSGARLLVDAIFDIENNNIVRIPQKEETASYYRPRKPSDGLIDWSKGAEYIYNLVRSLSRPYPGAFTYILGKKLTVWRVRIIECNEIDMNQVGEILNANRDNILVKTGEKLISIIDFDCEELIDFKEIEGMIFSE